MSKKSFLNGKAGKLVVYLIAITILLGILCFINPQYIPIALVIFVCFAVYTIVIIQQREEEIETQIKEITTSFDKVAKIAFMNAPIPLAIVNDKGMIIWNSNRFTDEFMETDINRAIKEIMKEHKVEVNNNRGIQECKIENQIELGERKYHVMGETVRGSHNLKNQNLAALYFLDETEHLKLEEQCKDSQICVGILTIDNYEEMMQAIEEEEKPQTIASVEKKIYDWASRYQGLMIKSDRDKFIAIFEQKALEKIQEQKFSILDEIKELNIASKIPATLSIAISNEGKSNYEKYKDAMLELDIVLGRGGDQAIVRKNGKYVFFGGRTQEVEKRTKVKARIVAQSLEELISETDRVMIMGHSNPDMDVMGAALGIYRLAKEMGKEVFIVNQNTTIGIEHFLAEARKESEYQIAFIDKLEALAKINADTLLVVVDTNKKDYVEIPELLGETNKIVVIDHHRRSTDYIEEAILTFQEVYASSACELVTEILEYAETQPTLKTIEVEGLYAGIMMDTKNFTFKTGVRTFEAAAYLRKCGVDIIKVKKMFQSDLEMYNKISDIVGNSDVIHESIAISTYTEPGNDANIICAKAADELLTISDITASFVIGNQDGKFCISGRSIGEINVQLILEKLGGGGHITLAGAQVEGPSMEEVKQELIRKIDEYFEEQQN